MRAGSSVVVVDWWLGADSRADGLIADTGESTEISGLVTDAFPGACGVRV